MDNPSKYRYRDDQGNWHNCTPEEISLIARSMKATPESVSYRIMGMDPGIHPVFSPAGVTDKGDGTYAVNWGTACHPDHLSQLMVDLEKNLKRQMAIPGYLLTAGRRFGKSYYYDLMNEMQKTAQCSRNVTMAFNLNPRETEIYRYRLWSGVIRGHHVEVNRLYRFPIRKPL